ncbi:alkaline phosphatase family protein [Nocardioides sp. YIM 152315]|uniref:alkaline phosphatase family protein n=1 Tax=Nocardioides sp. YIM 152315 TaxID=3031760 RepID=UPI0023D99C7B|nr:alkaline phosphatase family protein [Nocardioides sp. YIM 152315]MDF1601980.1 alkaline phosphatase family protein [Nocardioides sp. YIM 152315]
MGVLRWGDVGRAAVALVGAVLGVLIASWVVPSFDVGSWEDAVLAAVLIALCGVVLRFVLVRGAVLLGWVGAVLVGLFGQALAVWVVVYAPHGGDAADLGWALLASWIIAAVSTLFGWVATAGTDDAVTASLLRRARRHRHPIADPEVPGIVFVQADGVPYPVLDWCVRAGTLPTLSRWVRSGSHRAVEWRPRLPATTPASQMGILHGTIDGIPAFRWVDRPSGKVYVANRPADAAAIEATHSDGRGLLVDDGVSVSNLFTGDAPTAYATMSAIGRGQETRESRRIMSEYLSRPAGFARSMSRAISEIGRERFQSARARRRDIRPRVHRGWSFAMERAALTGVIRDLNTTLVAESMLRGRRSIYVDYVDYDAVAHHAGILQPESLDALAGIDAVLAQLEAVAAVAPRKYHLVVLSDHGQSQGAIFADRYGEDLAAVVTRLTDSAAVVSVENAEGSGSLHSMVAGGAGDDTVLGRALRRAAARASDRVAAETFETRNPGKEQQFLVFGSGNLGLVYVAGERHRLTIDELALRFPALVPGLVDHPGVGFVVVESAEHGPVAIGAAGEHRVRDGIVVGDDPLAAYGAHAAGFVLRAATMAEAPDIYVNSLIDDLDEVAAFEGLVACHGGLGGWQDRGMVVHPVDLEMPEQMVVGADALHRVLVGWQEQLGHRAALREGANP